VLFRRADRIRAAHSLVDAKPLGDYSPFLPRDATQKSKRRGNGKKKNSPPQRRPPSCFQNVPEHTRPASSLPSPPNSLPQNLTSHFFFSVLGRRDVSPSNEILDLGFFLPGCAAWRACIRNACCEDKPSGRDMKRMALASSLCRF